MEKLIYLGNNTHVRDSVTIRLLTEKDASILPTIVNWMYNWWGIPENYSIEEVACIMEHSLQKQKLPQTYGMFLNEKLIGMYQFTLSDLDVRPDIYPWLANLFIEHEFRGQGFSVPLIKSVKANARNSLHCHDLYLFTVHSGLYEKYGWQFKGEIDTFSKNPRIQRLYKLKI